MSNRVIKFRAWNTTYNWMESNFYIGAHDGAAYDVPSRTFDTPNIEIEESPDYVIMQFAGLHDKNGVEISEGDIVAHEKDLFLPSVVNFKDGSFHFWDLPATETDPDEWMVIGNIHENKELLS